MKTLLKFLVLFILGAACVIAIAFAVVGGLNKASEVGKDLLARVETWAVAKIPKRYAVQVVRPNDVPIEQLVEMVAQEFRINPIIVKAMAIQESGSYERANRVRFEPHLLDAALRPPAGLNEIERQLFASSHGLLQIVFGFHYKRCGLGQYDWDKLHEPIINLRCGLTILRDNLQTPKVQTLQRPADRLRAALKMYNGSSEYADAVMGRVADFLITDLGGGV